MADHARRQRMGRRLRRRRVRKDVRGAPQARGGVRQVASGAQPRRHPVGLCRRGGGPGGRVRVVGARRGPRRDRSLSPRDPVPGARPLPLPHLRRPRRGAQGRAVHVPDAGPGGEDPPGEGQLRAARARLRPRHRHRHHRRRGVDPSVPAQGRGRRRRREAERPDRGDARGAQGGPRRGRG